ncbi:MAG: dihydroorotate dehydrogenase electron transfer subunit [Bacteroidales bacterium]|jgi:dihydroorotate dehydrogenase electron transfer subunit|nr:dihydroorotate dehydrogenase electron transfer subunit [Bacteroidales bacterium]
MVFKKNVEDLTVIRNLRLNQRHFLLELQSEQPFSLLLPGQFVQALVKDSPSTFLRRPFSIHSVDIPNKRFRLLIQIKGQGTRHLSLLKEGDKLNLIYPLGNSFSIPTTKDVLLVGGGCGVAPLLFLAQFLNQQKIRPVILLGFRSQEETFEIEEYSKYGTVFITTDDGTAGEKGLVVDHSLLQKEKLDFRKIYCCGPDAMMKSIARIARWHKIDCEVSLENTMACGFGVCLCCITPTDKGNERVCMEGPVFNTKRLKW